MARSSNTAQELLETAVELLEAAGPEALTVRRVSQAAGMSTIGIYSHFRSKEGLVGAVWGAGFERLAAFLDSTERQPGLAGLVALAERYLTWARTHPHLYHLMFGVARPEMAIDDQARAASRTAFRLLVDSCHEDSSDPTRTALTIWQYLHGVASLAIADVSPPGVTPSTDVGEVVQMLARPSPGGL